MKKVASQIVIALVCAFLGFLLAYQFKAIYKNSKSQVDITDKDIIAEVDSLKKEKEELTKNNLSLSEELKKLEESALKEGEVEAEIKKQLDSARMHIGLVDVKGPGITIKITPKTNIFASGTTDITRGIGEQELVHIINLLWYANAEAIQINDLRITPQTGIKNSGNYVWVGYSGQIDPKKEIVIKAIGDSKLLNSAVAFHGSLEYGALPNYTIDIKLSDDVEILKTTQSLKTEFMKPVE